LPRHLQRFLRIFCGDLICDREFQAAFLIARVTVVAPGIRRRLGRVKKIQRCVGVAVGQNPDDLETQLCDG
jgi:hypothetical protein